MKTLPLIVDLDHTLIDTDLLYESSVAVIKKSPMLIFLYPFWLIKGKGYLKDQLVRRFTVDVKILPYNDITLNYIKERKSSGSKIILATASHKYYAFAVAKHLGIFDDVMATNKEFNLSSHNKAEKLIQRFGNKGFDYIGDHMRDLPVWEASNLSILVNVTKRVIKSTQHLEVLILSKKD
jgi:phosphoserine phosphatase